MKEARLKWDGGRPMTDLEKKALALYKGPFTYDPNGGGYIWDVNREMVADGAGSLVDQLVLKRPPPEDGPALRVRGWGRLLSMGDPPDATQGARTLQDTVGVLIARALTEFWEKNRP